MIDISTATLDVITAIKEKGAVKFTYKDKDISRYIKPVSFYGDFDGFEGVDISIDEYRKFSFNSVTEWNGVFNTPNIIQNKIDKLDDAIIESREITKEAKGLSYPIGDIMCKLSSLAETLGLDNDMEYMLESVREAQHNLESSFYDCESVFEEHRSTLQLELDEIEDV